MKRLRTICFCSYLLLLAPGSPSQPAKPATPQVENHRRGTEPAETVKVGLLLQNQQQAGLAARRSAEMAIAEANSKGGYHGRRFELIVRSVDGPWGAGSKEIVNLVFAEDVLAILASLDGRSAHVAEQIVAKGRIALVSAWASESTLTQINIPWFFRCVPDDRQQANALLKEIFPKRGLQRVAAVTAKTYDARMAAAAFSRAAATAGYPRPIELSYASDQDFPGIFNRIEDDDIEGVVLFGQLSSTAKLVKQMQARGLKQTLFAHLP
ncbi:MAG: ABC transporter substrate-binding protein, partial [bacterium]